MVRVKEGLSKKKKGLNRCKGGRVGGYARVDRHSEKRGIEGRKPGLLIPSPEKIKGYKNLKFEVVMWERHWKQVRIRFDQDH